MDVCRRCGQASRIGRALHLAHPFGHAPIEENEKKQADFENLGAKLQARRAITRPAMEQARKQKADDEEAAGKRSSTPLRDAFANAAGEFVQDGLKEGSKALGKEFRRQFRVGANPWQAAAVNLARLR